MLRFLLRLRAYLPSKVFTPLWQSYWRSFWNTECDKQQAELGSQAASSLHGSERAVLTEAIAESYPFSSLLEVGCSYGQLFHIIGPLFPDVCMEGIDPDLERIEAGSAHLPAAGLSHVLLAPGRAEDLSAFASSSFDLVVTSASQLYISPDMIKQAIAECKRVARKRLLFLEQHLDSLDDVCGAPGPARAGEAPYWIRNYRLLLQEFFPRDAISIRPVPAPLWRTESWKSLAHLVIVDLREEEKAGEANV